MKTIQQLNELEARKGWASYAAKMHGWPNGGIPEQENGRFVCGWHESEFQVFYAGVKFAQSLYQGMT